MKYVEDMTPMYNTEVKSISGDNELLKEQLFNKLTTAYR